MDISAGIKASLQGRYALALFDLAAEAGTVSAVEADCDTLEEALAGSPELRAMITSPQLTRGEQAAAIAAVASELGISELTTSFLGVLAHNRRLDSLGEMIRAFRTIAASQRGEVTAEVTGAHRLSEKQLEALRHRLTSREGRNVKINASVDPSLLGGLVVTIGSKRIDGSIRTRLNSLSAAMKG